MAANTPIESKRDLGFFNGVKTELITLIAGFVSFTILAEDAVNHIERLFHAEGVYGIWVFVTVYFVLPVLSILAWLVFVNYRDGLKARVLKTPGAIGSRFLFTVVLLITILIPGIFVLNLQAYWCLSLLVFAVILLYLVWLLCLVPRYVPNKREYHQAKIQLVVALVFLVAVWSPYFIGYINDEDFCDQWNQKNHLILASEIEKASIMRNTYRDQEEAASAFLDYLPDHVLNLSDGSELQSNYEKIWTAGSTSNTSKVSFFAGGRRFNADSIRYVVYRKQVENLKKYQNAWAPWLRTIQFKGLLLFTLLVMVLLAIWYHSYHLQLDGARAEEFSEISISRLSIYIVFLLIVPFFKPIDKTNLSFGKPYITFSNPISISNKFNVERPEPPAVPGDYPQMERVILPRLKRIDSLVERINKEMENVKKLPNK